MKRKRIIAALLTGAMLCISIPITTWASDLDAVFDDGETAAEDTDGLVAESNNTDMSDVSEENHDTTDSFTDDDVLVKMGGPMMGFPQSTLDVPMMKGSNGIIAIDTDETKEQPCIKCGRCVDVCPMELSPLYFVKYAKEENWQGMKDMNVMDCVECRCCQYICSSKIPIIDSIKAGKNAIRGMK